MGVILIIVLVVIVATVGLAYLGQRIGSNMEAPNLGAGTTEQSMRSALSPSVFGALLGIIPFMLFVVVLIWTAVHLPAEHPAGESGSSTAASH
jgi:hypothetical protein